MRSGYLGKVVVGMQYCRTLWVSEEAQSTWGPRLQRIGAAWAEVERESVASGVRDCAILTVDPMKLPQEVARLTRQGLVIVTMQRVGRDSHYSAWSRTPGEGESWNYRIMVTRANLVGETIENPYDSNNIDATTGLRLGYPSCCVSHFVSTCVNNGSRDPQWSQANNGTGRGNDSELHYTTGMYHPACNVMLRFIGVRAVPHLPCSMSCDGTVKLACELSVIWQEVDRDAYALAMDMLMWPAEWSALHGIAEVRTPLCKISASTDESRSTRRVRLAGWTYPEEGGGAGVRFPYDWKPTAEYWTSISMRESTDWYTDNGFSSAPSMERAHRRLVGRARRALVGSTSNRVVDLGCGNGALLARLRAESREPVEPFGIDMNARAVSRAQQIHSDHREKFAICNIFDSDWGQIGAYPDGYFGVVLLMVGRLLEANAEERSRVLSSVARLSDQCLLYMYGDWLRRYSSVTDILQLLKVSWKALATASPDVVLVRTRGQP